jgi:hypothetical protein
LNSRGRRRLVERRMRRVCSRRIWRIWEGIWRWGKGPRRWIVWWGKSERTLGSLRRKRWRGIMPPTSRTDPGVSIVLMGAVLRIHILHTIVVGRGKYLL